MKAEKRDRAGELITIINLRGGLRGTVTVTLPGIRFACTVEDMREAFHRGGGDVDPIVRYVDASKMIGVHQSTLRRYVNDGTMPAPFTLSRGVVGWRRSTVEAYIAGREAGAVVR